ncbi:glycoside hydrolase family 16 protein [Nocardioides baculatus]|uniref:Glycoside hydrolase family 16 protein n=1 Tax=Nocardioides baculatus TaxID=2801337 RepID=A0ABS1L5Z3_9ACTN|nr:glycoside hydrolase family 16 protein [Nocardioides baculatus]MBL0747116.1 glycoside hydrolase family 16 protein [Nocardioides baculatus]
MPLPIRSLLVGLALAVSLLAAPSGSTTVPSRADAEVGTGTLELRPAIAQPGKRPARSLSQTQALATFSEGRTGQVVVLQRDDGSGWQTVARGRQHRSGSTIFTLPDTTSLYRAVALSRSGDARAVTDIVRGRAFTTLFRDEFSRKRLDRTKWTDQPTLAPAHMRMCSRLSSKARTISAGVLRMGVAQDPARAGQTCSWTLNGRSGSHPYMLNTQLYTGGKFDFTYGYAAVRMKMHLDKGMHASFWMQPANWYTPGDPSKGTEIDVVEFFGRTKKDSHIAAFLHWYDADNTHYKLGGKFPGANRLKKRAETWSNAFHVFSAEWTPQAIVFRVDGREFHRETRIVSQAPQYLLLSMLTSDYELEKLTPGIMRQTAKVDWVRVWSR